MSDLEHTQLTVLVGMSLYEPMVKLLKNTK